jgi:hypothetical protein
LNKRKGKRRTEKGRKERKKERKRIVCETWTNDKKCCACCEKDVITVSRNLA